MDDREPLTSGQVFTEKNEASLSAILKEAFPQTQVRESSHYSTGKYVLIDFASEAEFFFERINDHEYLIRGECADSQSQAEAAEAIAKHLGGHGFKCRFETYGEGDAMVAYAHHEWPLHEKPEANKTEQATLTRRESKES